MTDEKPKITFLGDLIGNDGRTIREANLAQPYELSVGDIVEIEIDHDWPGIIAADNIKVKLQGRCRLYIVAQLRDCDGSPLYMMADIPVAYPLDTLPLAPPRQLYKSIATLVESGHGERDVIKTGQHRTLYATIADYLDSNEE